MKKNEIEFISIQKSNAFRPSKEMFGKSFSLLFWGEIA